MPDLPTWTISQLAADLGTSPRSIRFYEEKGLLSPARTGGGYRIYTKRDRARLKLILRGKRFGLTLDDVEGRLTELKRTRRELLEIERQMHARLAELEPGAASKSSRRQTRSRTREG